MVLSCSLSDLATLEDQLHGPDPLNILHGRLAYCDRMFSTWALWLLGNKYTRDLSEWRDEIATVGEREPIAVEEVDAVSRKFDVIQRSVLPFAEEILEHCHTEKSFRYDLPVIKSLAPDKFGRGELFTNIRHDLLKTASWLLTREAQMRATADRSAALTAAATGDRLARANLGLQRRIYWLTWALLVLTLVLAGIEVFGRWNTLGPLIRETWMGIVGLALGN